MEEQRLDMSERARVLVVEDLPEVRLVLRRILRRAGYECLEAEDVPVALEALAEEAVDLVLCDLQMPGASGLDLLKVLRPRIPHTAVVMMSANEDAETALACLAQGTYGYVLKPFQPREVLVQVDGALRRRRRELALREREARLAGQVWEQTLELRSSREELAHRLVTASEQRDHETGMHVRRMGLYAAELARLVGWDEAGQDAIQAAAPLHDIGKIGVPDAILQKPGALTPEEWGLMKLHTSMGAAILQGSAVPFIQMGARIALGHHERWDGQGYPLGLRGEAIPLEARITALADVYDAMSHRRHYKEPWPEGQVVQALQEGSGAHFDPRLVDLFLAHLEVFREILRTCPDEVGPGFPGI